MPTGGQEDDTVEARPAAWANINFPLLLLAALVRMCPCTRWLAVGWNRLASWMSRSACAVLLISLHGGSEERPSLNAQWQTKRNAPRDKKIDPYYEHEDDSRSFMLALFYIQYYSRCRFFTTDQRAVGDVCTRSCLLYVCCHVERPTWRKPIVDSSNVTSPPVNHKTKGF